MYPYRQSDFFSAKRIFTSAESTGTSRILQDGIQHDNADHRLRLLRHVRPHFPPNAPLEYLPILSAAPKRIPKISRAGIPWHEASCNENRVNISTFTF